MSTQTRGSDPIDNIARFLVRGLLVPLGYFCAVVAGAAVIVIGEWQVGTLFQTAAADEMLMGVMLAVVTSVTLLVTLLSFMWMVAAPGILFSELFAVRSWLFHAANGVVSAWIGAGLADGQLGTSFGPQPGDAVVVGDPFFVIAAGLAGGLVYWLVAGFSAGFYKPVLRAAREAAARRAEPLKVPEPAPDTSARTSAHVPPPDEK